MKTYSLNKSKKILLEIYKLLKKKKKNLLPAQVNEIKNDLESLQAEILGKDKEKASVLAHRCAGYSDTILKKGKWQQARDFILALLFALAVALVIRQVWFELYEIPTGSMRPTFKEKDRLIVSKTDFGINIPFTTDQFYFDPDLALRSGIIVFSVANLDVYDPDMMYFWIFPGKKQYVKRMMGRPGDTVYFYGGKMYGIDKEGNDITDQLQLSCLEKIDHVPFIHFDGMVSLSEPFRSPIGNGYRMAIIHQMNEAIARLTYINPNRIEGELLHSPRIHDRGAPMPSNYYQLWGMENYAETRIVRRDEIRDFAENNGVSLGNAQYFLELKHHPNFNDLYLGKDFYGRVRPKFRLSTSIIPLDESHLEELFANLYTARFVVKNGFAKRYSGEGPVHTAKHNLIRLEGVPDGTYEFYHGKPSKIGWLGIETSLPKNHPLWRYSTERLAKLFNFGFEFDKYFNKGADFASSRYAYFRDGDLYLLGAPIFKKDDPILMDFVDLELTRGRESSSWRPYAPFVDLGPPLDENGKIDREKLHEFGLVIPPKMYLALGDNFAMSADSRAFGFVPQGNLRGSPSFIFWPFGKRFGPPNQPSFPWVTLPHFVVWTLALLCFICWYVVHRRHTHLPLKFDL